MLDKSSVQYPKTTAKRACAPDRRKPVQYERVACSRPNDYGVDEGYFCQFGLLGLLVLHFLVVTSLVAKPCMLLPQRRPLVGVTRI